MPKKAIAVDVVFCRRHADFRLENLFGAMWREAVVAEKAAFWGSLTLVMKSLFPGNLDLFQPYLLAWKRAHRAIAVAFTHTSGAPYSRGHIADFQESVAACFILYRLKRRLVGSFARRGKNVEWDSARLRGCDSDEPGKDVPICCRHNAMENQIHRDRVGNHFRGPDLHCEPGAAVFEGHSGVKQRRQRRASDRVRFDRCSFSSKRVR